MIKREELSNPKSCMSKARDDEMTFVLLGRDKAAPTAIRSWVMERINIGKNKESDPQIQEALACATSMDGRTLQPEDLVWITREEMKSYCSWAQDRSAASQPDLSKSHWIDSRIKKQGTDPNCRTCEGYGFITIRGRSYQCKECPPAQPVAQGGLTVEQVEALYEASAHCKYSGWGTGQAAADSLRAAFPEAFPPPPSAPQGKEGA